jgi:aspartate aminotransferase-like enzyme/N-acyl-L-homoserine lactone synthetase
MLQLCDSICGYEAMTGIQFKEAETSFEIEQIHRLNHRVFAEEIGQHPRTPDGHLVDRFHDHNRYFIALKDGALVGMVSVHDGPDFSIASRLHDATILRDLRAPLEVRLLAILPEFRDGSLLAGLFWQVNKYAKSHGYSDLLISGIVEREPMYAKMGFRRLGPPVRCGSAEFVPMRLSLEKPPTEFSSRLHLYGSRWQRNHALSLLPGPVELSEPVIRAFHVPPVSHRSRPFLELYEETRSRLSKLMGGLQTVILGGSGTLANDVVAANLRAAFGDAEGLVLANGEFGERLLRQANRAGLSYRQLRYQWGKPWNFAAIEETLTKRPAWIWAVHLETSTGVLNDLPRLVALAHRHGIPVAADCVSSLGAVDPHGPGMPRLFLASGVTGKALGSYAGLAFVFVSPEAIDRLDGKTVCPTFDLIEAIRSAGPVSTVSSPLVSAVCEALRQNYNGIEGREARYSHYESLGRWTRAQIRAAGLVPLAAEEIAAPTVTTFPLPHAGFPRQCLRAGFKIAHESDYLRERGWGQIATMGNLDCAALEMFFETLRAEVHLTHV